MKKVKILPLLLLLLLGQGKNLFAQFKCGMPSPTDQQKKELLNLYQSFVVQKSARLTNYKVAVKVNVVSANTATNFLTENDVRNIISNANAYLQNINVQLYLLNDQVYEIKDDRYANFKIVDENILRASNDVQNAINIYFVKQITLQDLTILSGYAALPSLSSSGNRIFYSYYDRTADDFNNLKNKTFLHEIGHYFGLLHTFQDSNNPDISKRELVTREAGSNCVSTGDQLCDTPADPFERLPLIYAYNCTQSSPLDLQDVNGDTFRPSIDNIMSYQQRCGNAFTEQQYQKMQASFAIRFSSLAEYQIVARNSNFVTVEALDKKVYCVGDSLKITFNLEGLFENDNQLFVDISDKFGRNYQRIESRFNGTKIAIKLPSNLPEGDDYRIQLTASRPETISPVSENFAIRTFPNATLTASNNNIYPSESTNLQLSFGGSGTWSFELSDGTVVKNFRQNTYNFTKTPIETTTYSVVSIKNMCGEGQKGNPVTINVLQPQIQAEILSTNTICQGQNIKLTISITGKLSSNSQLVIQISDQNGNNFTDLPTQVSLFNVSAQIPPFFQTGTGYRLKVMAKNTDYFSSILGPITIIAPPQAPTIAETQSFCQNSSTSPLAANGSNLKWYMGEFDIKSFEAITPPTGKEGQYIYYVSQSNSFGCESKKAKTTVNIIPLVNATISGDAAMLSGNSTILRVNIVGELPTEIKLSDGRSFVCNQTPFSIEVRPTKSSIYTIKEAKNSCGVGFVFGSAKITILEPLAAEDTSPETVKVFPNPADEQVIVDFFAITNKNNFVSIVDNKGRVLEQKEIKSAGQQQEKLNINHYPAGIYFIKTRIDKKVSINKIMVER